LFDISCAILSLYFFEKHLAEKDYQEAKKDYEHEIKEDPKNHQDMKQFKGTAC
jgi:regulatory protein YycI of two-component signal transduction system YycFG